MPSWKFHCQLFRPVTAPLRAPGFVATQSSIGYPGPALLRRRRLAREPDVLVALSRTLDVHGFGTPGKLAGEAPRLADGMQGNAAGGAVDGCG